MDIDNVGMLIKELEKHPILKRLDFKTDSDKLTKMLESIPTHARFYQEVPESKKVEWRTEGVIYELSFEGTINNNSFPRYLNNFVNRSSNHSLLKKIHKHPWIPKFIKDCDTETTSLLSILNAYHDGILTGSRPILTMEGRGYSGIVHAWEESNSTPKRASYAKRSKIIRIR